jgi:hypothetical protein
MPPRRSSLDGFVTTSSQGSSGLGSVARGRPLASSMPHGLLRGGHTTGSIPASVLGLGYAAGLGELDPRRAQLLAFRVRGPGAGLAGGARERC